MVVFHDNLDCVRNTATPSNLILRGFQVSDNCDMK